MCHLTFRVSLPRTSLLDGVLRAVGTGCPPCRRSGLVRFAWQILRQLQGLRVLRINLFAGKLFVALIRHMSKRLQVLFVPKVQISCERASKQTVCQCIRIGVSTALLQSALLTRAVFGGHWGSDSSRAPSRQRGMSLSCFPESLLEALGLPISYLTGPRIFANVSHGLDRLATATSRALFRRSRMFLCCSKVPINKHVHILVCLPSL